MTLAGKLLRISSTVIRKYDGYILFNKWLIHTSDSAYTFSLLNSPQYIASKNKRANEVPLVIIYDVNAIPNSLFACLKFRSIGEAAEFLAIDTSTLKELASKQTEINVVNNVRPGCYKVTIARSPKGRKHIK